MTSTSETIAEQSVIEREGCPEGGLASTPIPRAVKDQSKHLSDSVDKGARPKVKNTVNLDLKDSIEHLRKENEALELKMVYDELAQKNSELKSKMKNNDKHSKKDKIPPLQKLRDDKELNKLATKLGKAVLIESSSDSDSNSSDSDDKKSSLVDKGMTFYKTFPNSKKKTAVSGEARLAKDRVKYDVPWPHEFAQHDSVSFNDKDFGLLQLMRGEVYILQNVEAKFGKERQLHLLNLLYLAEKFPISEIKAFHSEVLRSIEKGLKTWNDSFADEKYRTLVTSVGTAKKDSRSPICGAFQAGSCTYQKDHYGKFGDKKLLHSCRKCVKSGKNPFDPTCRHPSKSCTVDPTS